LSIQWTAPSGVDQTNEAQNTNRCGLSGGLTPWLFAAEYAPATCWVPERSERGERRKRRSTQIMMEAV
jgi:hypothetical protein